MENWLESSSPPFSQSMGVSPPSFSRALLPAKSCCRSISLLSVVVLVVGELLSWPAMGMFQKEVSVPRKVGNGEVSMTNSC